MPSSKSDGLRFMCVGTNCVTGISVSSTIRRSSSRPRRPSPMCTFTTPALPDRMPPRRASAATRANSSKVGCVERWSESATSPDADHLVDQAGGRARCCPVIVCTGTRVAARVDERADALLVEPAGLGEQPREAARHAVRAEAADHGGDAAANRVGERQCRGAGGEPALAAAAHQVHVGVDEAWHRQEARRIDDLAVAGLHADAGGDCARSGRRRRGCPRGPPARARRCRRSAAAASSDPCRAQGEGGGRCRPACQ